MNPKNPPSLLQLSIKNIRKNIHLYEPFSMYFLDQKYDLPLVYLLLKKEAKNFIMDHFSNLKNSIEFSNLSYPQVVDILSMDVCVDKEEEFYSAALSWIEHDLKNRRENLHMILKTVRLPLLEESTLFRIKDLYEGTIEDIVKNALTLKHKNHLPEPRRKVPKFIIICGGQKEKLVEMLDINSQKVRKLQEMMNTRVQFGVACVNGVVFALGGTEMI